MPFSSGVKVAALVTVGVVGPEEVDVVVEASDVSEGMEISEPDRGESTFGRRLFFLGTTSVGSVSKLEVATCGEVEVVEAASEVAIEDDEE